MSANTFSSTSSTSTLLRSIAPPIGEQNKEEKDAHKQIFTTHLKTTNRQQSNDQTTLHSVVVKQRPAVPPKPQLDIVRFSMAQARDEIDLDTILTELLELEEQLSGEAGDRLVLGLPTLSSYTQKHLPSTKDSQLTTQLPSPQMVDQQQHVTFQHFINENSNSSVKSFPTGSSSSNSHLHTTQTNGLDFNDCDSAFGDSSSTESASQIPSNGNALLLPRNAAICNSEFSSADSFRGSLNTPSPTRQLILNSGQQNGTQLSCPTSSLFSGGPRPPSSAGSYNSAVATSNDENKKAKIREALEKLKEAKMKKIFVKIFLEDGTQRGILLDERWTVTDTMKHLAVKLNCALTPAHAIVEKYPKLLIKRIYEDNEFVVENLEEWGENSPNELHFVRMHYKWSLFHSPQQFLLTDRNRSDFPSINQVADWDSLQKQRLLESYLGDNTSGSGGRVPELEGWLLLKLDGKKSWRRHFFVLRASGLYYVPKPGKTRGPTCDLQCLMSVFNNQVYMCTDWRKKYKAPTEWGFAIKHPRVQLKSSKFVKYICAEDEYTFNQWISALRIIKNGFSTLYKAFRAAHVSPVHVDSCSLSVHVEIPQVPFQNNLRSPIGIHSPCRRPPYVSASPCSTPGFVGSPVAMRADIGMPHSLRTSSDTRFGSPTTQSGRLAFERDFCNTIKRQPDPTNSVISQQHQQNNFVHCPFTENFFESANIHTNRVEENDSDEADEEFFPLPPPPSSLPTSPIRASKRLPPPPPKRAEGTRLQSIQTIDLPSTTTSVKQPLQMDLMAELTLATNRQKKRIENRISNNN